MYSPDDDDHHRPMALSLMQLKRMAEYRAFLDRQKREHEELKVKTHEEQAKAREEQVRSYEVSRQAGGRHHHSTASHKALSGLLESHLVDPHFA